MPEGPPPPAEGETPITIGSGSVWVKYDWSKFDRKADKDEHKNKKAVITGLKVNGESRHLPDGPVTIEVSFGAPD